MDILQYRQSKYGINEQFIHRWSSRSFKEEAIPEEKVFAVLEAASWAPSARNRQPWRFIIAQTEEERNRFYTFLNEGNLVWCKKAPVLILLLAKKTADDGEFNRFHQFDAGTSWGFMALEAYQQGLNTRAMGGFDREKAKEVLNIPDDYEPLIVVALGYAGKKEDLPESHRDREIPTTRRPLEESILKAPFEENL